MTEVFVMKRQSLIAAAALLLAIRAESQVQTCTSATGRSVTVNGAATLHLMPDQVSFTVGVETESQNVGEAFRLNTQKVNRVIEALKRKGVTPRQIQTS